MAERGPETIQLGEGLTVPRIDILTGLLITERKSVLFVGEGDFSFTVAFAALRKSEESRSTGENYTTWEGIIATRYEPELEKWLEATFSDILDICKLHCRKYCQYRGIDSQKKEEELQKLGKESPPRFYYGIDACRITEHHPFLPRFQVIWFQCPWINRYTYPRPGTPSNTYSLILEFLDSASRNLQLGGHTRVGISTYNAYVPAYTLWKLCTNWKDKTQNKFEKDILSKYDFLGADDKLVESVLQFGYHHKSITTNDIHDLIRDCHVTLVFRRKSTSQCSRY